jgi:hypothetical protein
MIAWSRPDSADPKALKIDRTRRRSPTGLAAAFFVVGRRVVGRRPEGRFGR